MTLPATPPAPPVVRDDAAGADPLALARALQDGLYRTPSAGHAGYERYRSLREGNAPDLSPSAQLELVRIGQHLAYATGDLTAATRYRAAAEILENAHTEPVPARLRADGVLLDGLTDSDTIDVAIGFERLRAALGSDLVGHATPALVTEARGFAALVLVLVGDLPQGDRMLQATQLEIDAHGLGGAARAAADVTLMLRTGATVGARRAHFARARDDAAAHSLGTAYRSHFHYATMLTSYISGQIELATASYGEILQEARWARYEHRLQAMSHLSYALLLAARGQFGTAQAELAAALERHRAPTPAMLVVHGLIALRLDLAAGRTARSLGETSPTGPLWPERVQQTLPRFVPAVLLTRGAALWRDGMQSAGAELFARATRQSSLHDEFLALAGAETEEYRSWLAGLDPEDLPDDVATELRDALLARPILVSHSLPVLTGQQTRILGRLAMGQSTASIAKELGITQNTLKSHLRLLYRRLGVSSRKQAVILAEEYGLLH